MSLPTHIQQTYTAILREELVPAMGCTEPIAIAYAASILRHALGADPTSLHVELSGNIIKNVKSVIVPATDGMHGIEAAVAAGIVAGCPDRKLEVLCALKPSDADRIRDFLHTTTPAVSELDTKHPFELVMTGTASVEGREITARVHLIDRHTNVVSVTRTAEGEVQDLTDRYLYGESREHTQPADRSLLNVQDIVTFAEEAGLTELKPLLMRQIQMNMAIAEEGLRCEYGASIGRLLYNGGHCDLRTKARAYAAAGMEVDPALIVEVGNRPEDINTVIKQLLVKRVTFDAIIGTEDIVALGAQKALQRTGLSMPVIGFHNTLIASCATPALTSVDCDPAALAGAAIQVLEDLTAGRTPRTLTVIPTKLVERDTFRNA